MSLEQTRSRDHYPCHQSGEAREQQQIMHDVGHRKSPLRSAEQSLRAVSSPSDETGEGQQVVQGTDGHRSPPYAASCRASQDVGQNVMEDGLNLAGCLKRRKTASAVGFRSQAFGRVA